MTRFSKYHGLVPVWALICGLLMGSAAPALSADFPPLGPAFSAGGAAETGRSIGWQDRWDAWDMAPRDSDPRDRRDRFDRGRSRDWDGSRGLGRWGREWGGSSVTPRRPVTVPVSLDEFPMSPVRDWEPAFPELDPRNWETPRRTPRDEWEPAAPVRPPAPPAKPRFDDLSESEQIQLRLTNRYEDPILMRFVQRLPVEQALQLYQEASRLLDSRHLEPRPYAQRVEQGLKNLAAALQNPSFIRSNNVRVSAADGPSLASELTRMRVEQVRTVSDAIALMRNVMDVMYRRTGLHPSVVALEFVYGAVEVHDKYSSFEPDRDAGRPSASLEDHVVGIGVEIKTHEDGALVVKVLPNGPAKAAGLQKGDIMIAINRQRLTGLSLAQVVDRIAGPAGSALSMTVLRDGRYVELQMRRQRVEILSVSDVQIVDAETGVGYLKLDRFAQSSSREIDEALWSLHRQGMKSLIFDVRGNPGGLLTAAIEISDKFLPCGTIVSTRGRLSSDNSSNEANLQQTWKVPLVVLVDGDSASASEIFAAAIQENGRGLVVGRRSYGKGTVQTHFPLQTVSGNLRITTARFFSPQGRQMAGAGVTPDVPVAAADTAVAPLHQDQDVLTAVRVAGSSAAASRAEAGAYCRTQGR